MTKAEIAAWKYLTRLALMFVWGFGAVACVVAGIAGETRLAASAPIAVFLFVVALKWKVPNPADWLKEGNHE